MAKVNDYDVVLVGGGHNGLTCAGYLARQGLSVAVLEKRDMVGGAASTQEFYPGFRATTWSFVVGLLEPKVIEDLELRKYGFELISRAHGAFMPEKDGPGFIMPKTLEESVTAIREFSEHDAKAYRRFDADVTEAALFLKKQVLKTPPNISGGFSELFKLLPVVKELYGISSEKAQLLVNLFSMSVGDFLDGYFETDALKGSQAFGAMTGQYLSPYAPGTAYGLLHHAWGTTDGVQGKFNLCKGGMGGITQAMARSAEAYGADIRVSAGVQEVLVHKGRATGVLLEDGTTVSGRVVVSNLNPRLLFGKLVDEALVPEEFSRRMSSWRCSSGSFRMNVALDKLPDFNGRPGIEQQDHHTCSMFFSPSLQYCEEAYLTAQTQGYSENPIMDITIPSTLDDSLAPPGKHVATIFVQHVAPELPNGRSWDSEKEKVADHVLAVLDQYAGNFSSSVIAREIWSPADLERELGMVGGDIFHGSLSLDQIYSFRPAAGYADYRTPIKALYMCGSGTHPGGGVTGAPGHNAAREIIEDLRKKRI